MLHYQGRYRQKYIYYSAGYKHLVARICPSRWSLVVKCFFHGQIDGCIGFGSSKPIEKYVSILLNRMKYHHYQGKYKGKMFVFLLDTSI